MALRYSLRRRSYSHSTQIDSDYLMRLGCIYQHQILTPSPQLSKRPLSPLPTDRRERLTRLLMIHPEICVCRRHGAIFHAILHHHLIVVVVVEQRPPQHRISNIANRRKLHYLPCIAFRHLQVNVIQSAPQSPQRRTNSRWIRTQDPKEAASSSFTFHLTRLAKLAQQPRGQSSLSKGAVNHELGDPADVSLVVILPPSAGKHIPDELAGDLDADVDVSRARNGR